MENKPYHKVFYLQKEACKRGIIISVVTLLMVSGILFFYGSVVYTPFDVYSYIMILFFALMWLFIADFYIWNILLTIQHLTRKKPFLTVTEKGITLTTSLKKETFIPWKDISRFERATLKREPVIKVLLYNPKEYLAKEQDLIKRYLLKKGLAKYQTIYQIKDKQIDTEINDISAFLNTCLDHYKMHQTD